MKTQHVAILMALALVVPTASCSRCNKSKGGGGGGSASGSGTSGGGDGTASAARPSTIDREVKLDWPGKVVRASGATKAKAGDTCNIETRFASDGARTLLSQVSMTCGGQKIYQGGSGAGLNCRVNESPLSGTRYRYLLTCNDQGKRSGMAASLNTENKRARVAKSGKDAFRVVMQLEKSFIEREGKPLSKGNEPSGETFATVVRKGKVKAVSGDAPVKVGDACELRIKATGRRGLSCHIGVKCGETEIYGKAPAGYMRCAIKDGKPPSAMRDDVVSGVDADPQMHFDLTKGELVVSDGPAPKNPKAKVKALPKGKQPPPAAKTYKVEISLGS